MAKTNQQLRNELAATFEEREQYRFKLQEVQKELARYTCDGAYVSMEFHERKIKELQENYLSDLHRLIQRIR